MERPEHFPKEMLLDLVQLQSIAMDNTTKESWAKDRNIKDYEVPLGEDEDDIMEDLD